MNPKLSLVTGTVNRPEHFARLVASIQKHTTVSWELVVSDASETPVEIQDDRVRILPERPKLGCVKAYNRAFKECRGQWVIWLNDDAEVTEGYDAAAIAFMEAHPQIGLGCLHYSEPENDKPFHCNSSWGVVYANFGIIRRELGEQVHWFDQGLVMYGNDNSLTFRVLLADKGVAQIPDARIIHHAVKDAMRDDNQKYKARDNAFLSDSYLPLRRYWLANFRKHFVQGQPEPWGHGLKPEQGFGPSEAVKESLRSKGIRI